MSPDMIINGVYTTKNDIWALGILLYEMLHGKNLYKSTSIKKLKVEMKEIGEKYDIRKDIDKRIQQLLRSLLIHDQFDRPDINMIMQYPIIK